MTNDLKALRESQIREIYTVNADAKTGEWLSEPENTGETSNAWEWSKRVDTDSQHFDTYVYDSETQDERALIVTWA